jgi:hypothetical protein
MKAITPLTAAEIAEFERLDLEIISRMPTVEEVFVLAMRIKEKELWRGNFKSWDDYCRERFGKGAEAFRKFGSRKESRKLLAETTGESYSEQKPDKLSVPNSTKPKELERNPEKVSAKVDREGPAIEVHKPPDLPRTEQLSIEEKWKRLLKDLDWLHHQPISSDQLRVAARAYSLAKEVHDLLQPSLPLEVESSKKRSKGTREECITYCKLVGLSESDGEWFFQKCVGCGWKNNGHPMNDWQATVNAWKITGVFPSQKTGSHATRNSNFKQGAPNRNAGTFNNDPSIYRDVGKVV